LGGGGDVFLVSAFLPRGLEGAEGKAGKPEGMVVVGRLVKRGRVVVVWCGLKCFNCGLVVG